MDRETVLQSKFGLEWRALDERTRRLTAAREAVAWGHGGVAAVHRASGLSRTTIARGIAEMATAASPGSGRVRRSGGGRKSLIEADSSLLATLDRAVAPEPEHRPDSPLHWVPTTTRALATRLREEGYSVSHVDVARWLRAQKFRLQSSRRVAAHDGGRVRDEQFHHINAVVKRALGTGGPVLSVDTVRNVAPGTSARCQSWFAANQPVRLPLTSSFGIYEIGRRNECVNVLTGCDAGAFAVASIRGWWRADGHRLYPRADELVVTADAMGKPLSRMHIWMVELQKLADLAGLVVKVCHFPWGSRRWNKVEHPLFSFYVTNWKGWRQREDETTVSLIANSTTATILPRTCRLDRRRRSWTAPQVSRTEINAVELERVRFHGRWNYLIQPH